MPEKLIYADEYRAPTPLGPALRLVGLETLQNSSMQHLYTSGLGNLHDRYATGIGGKHKGLTWTIRWDWDETKGEHVNVVMTRDRKGTEKIAFLSQNRKVTFLSRLKGPTGVSPTGEVAYMGTIQRFTMDCQFSADRLKAFAGHQARESEKYKRECAENGRKRWCYVLMADLEAEKERAREEERKKQESRTKKRPQ
jgi:hypothetical protein